MLSIGTLARQTGVKVPTIRYYEQIGLLHAPDRSEGGQRRYEPAVRARLSFIRHCRDLGLGIGAIGDLLRLSAHAERPCADIDSIAATHLAAVRQKIEQLESLEAELSRIATACDHGKVADCRVIQALADHHLCEGAHRIS